MWFAAAMGLGVIPLVIFLGVYPGFDDVTAIRYLLAVVGGLLALGMVALDQLVRQTRGSVGE